MKSTKEKEIDTSCTSCGEEFPVTRNNCPTCDEKRYTLNKDTLEFTVQLGKSVEKSRTFPQILQIIGKYCPKATAQELEDLEKTLRGEFSSTLRDIFGDVNNDMGIKEFDEKTYAYVPRTGKCYLLIHGDMWRNIFTGDRDLHPDLTKQINQPSAAPKPAQTLPSEEPASQPASQSEQTPSVYQASHKRAVERVQNLIQRAEYPAQPAPTPQPPVSSYQGAQPALTPASVSKETPKEKPRATNQARVAAGEPVEIRVREEPYRSQPSQKSETPIQIKSTSQPKPQPPIPSADLREAVSDLIKYTELIGKDVDETKKALEETQENADSLESKLSKRFDKIEAGQRQLFTYTNYLGDELKRTNRLYELISNVKNWFSRKVKGEPKVPIPTPASVSAPIPAPVRLVSMRTEDNAKVYAFETNDGLKANVYESKTGPNVVLEYFTPAGQRSLYLLTPDKILNPVDKTPVTPVSAVSDFHQAWRMQAGLTTSLK